MHAQELNLLHVLLLLSAGACLYFSFWENRQRTIGLRRHFWSPGFAILAALVLMFFQVGLKHPVRPFLAVLALGLAIGVARGLTLKLRVDRSWKVPRPAGSRNSIWIAALLAAAAAVDIAGAAIGGDAKIWRFYAALVATGCSGLLFGRAIVLAVRVWRLIG